MKSDPPPESKAPPDTEEEEGAGQEVPYWGLGADIPDPIVLPPWLLEQEVIDDPEPEPEPVDPDEGEDDTAIEEFETASEYPEGSEPLLNAEGQQIGWTSPNGDKYYTQSDGSFVVIAHDMGVDPESDITGLIEQLAGISKDSAAQQAAMKGQEGAFKEATDRMIREGALRRMGSGGAFARGFGTIAGKFAGAMNADALKAKELELNGLGTAISNYVNLHSTELDAETKQMLANWQVHTDKIAQFHAEVNNWLKDTETSGMNSAAYAELYTLFNDLVLSGETNPATDKPWTTADIMKNFYMKREGKLWFNGLKPDGTWDSGSLKSLQEQFAGIDNEMAVDVLKAMIWQMKELGGKDGKYDDYIAQLEKLMKSYDWGPYAVPYDPTDLDE